jgi:hypothetical protein
MTQPEDPGHELPVPDLQRPRPPMSGTRGMPDELDPLTPLFCLSYAHPGEHLGPGPPREPSRDVIKFFDDLAETVGDLVPRQQGSYPGYMDRSIPEGGHWSHELLAAIGTCQVFVALLSPSYFVSLWCSKEWDAFSQRKSTPRAGSRPDHQTGIIPVIWAPILHERVPPVISDIQRFSPHGLPDPDIAAHYQENGVLGLLRMWQEPAYQAAYQAVVWRLAQRIARRRSTHWVETHIFRQSELRDIFQEQRP